MRYGHLRPHTYDICSACYQTCDDYFSNHKSSTHSNSLSDVDQDLIAWNNENLFSRELSDLFPSYSADYLYDFLVTSVQSREANKFEFTKYLSASLEMLFTSLSDFDLSRQDISNLEISTIYSLLNNVAPTSDISSLLHKSIALKKSELASYSTFHVPDMIVNVQNLI